MPLAHVQSRGVAGAGQVPTLALAFLSNPQAGNMIVVCATTDSAVSPSVTDSLGNTYTPHPDNPQTANNNGVNRRVLMFWCVNITGGACTVTFDPGDISDYCAMCISEHSGQAITAQPNAYALGWGSSTAVLTASIVTTQRATIVGMMVLGAAGSTIAPDYTERFEVENEDGPNTTLAVQDRIDLAAGTYDMSWTLDISNSWACLGAAFAEGELQSGTARQYMAPAQG